MSLPKLEFALFDVEIPSTKQTIKVRQMLVKDEKILLMAKANDPSKTDSRDIFNAIAQVVQNCIVTPGINAVELALFDMEYIFLKLRQFSVASKFDAMYSDSDEINEYEQGLSMGEMVQPPEPYKFNVELEKVKIKFPENQHMTIDGPHGIKLHMQYPKASLYNDENFKKMEFRQALDHLIIHSIKDISLHGTNHTATMPELQEFIDNLPINVNDKLLEFVQNLPKLHYEIDYKNKQGKDKKIILNTLSDFFYF